MGITQQELERDFRSLGVSAGQVILVHSSMCAMGSVEGGAEAVATALLNILDREGTVVVPTFSEGRRDDEEPIIDPVCDPSHMGWLSETVRIVPGAKRSLDYRHSVAAVGARAEAVVANALAVSVFAQGGSFWNLLDLDARILLLGVSYQACTAMHLVELALNVPFRHLVPKRALVRQADGSLQSIIFMDYQPNEWLDRPYDLNKLGKIMEEAGLVRVLPVGNAVARFFRMRDLLETGLRVGEDPYLFLIAPGERETTLEGGRRLVWGEYWQEWYVVDPEQVYHTPAGPSLKGDQPR